jgi:tetratricopeptide (TPR) repeat protein
MRQVEGIPDAFELIHPRCVAEAELDYQEGIDLWKAGDPEEARDALRYALGACRDNLWVHVALGQLALQEFKDPALARGHFGYAVELGNKALPPAFSGRLPRDRVGNRPFFEAIEGLAESLRAIGKSKDADGMSSLAARLAGAPPRRSV